MNVITNNDIKCALALSALQSVMDPEIGLNVVDLGLIYRLDFDEIAGNVSLSMTLTTQFCPMGEAISEGATLALQQAFPENNVQLDLVFEPPWNSSMITEEGNKFLNG